MDESESSKIAESVGKMVEQAQAIRKTWVDRHAKEAEQGKDRKEQWEEVKPFWMPWFRGHEQAGWQLTPKLYRGSEVEVNQRFKFEEDLRGEFKRRGSQLVEGLRFPDYDDEWGWYGLMQHYGAPTRLLDWSDGALIALYFAVREPGKEAKAATCSNAVPDACVWMLDPYRLNPLLLSS